VKVLKEAEDPEMKREILREMRALIQEADWKLNL